MFSRTAISLAVAMCTAGLAHAQAIVGNISGTAKAGSTVTLTAPGGATSTTTVSPDGTFTFTQVAPGTYRLVSDGVSRDVVVSAGVGTRVELATASLDAITVTGSRIARDTFSSTSPVLVITRDEATMSGFNSTTDVLQGTGVTAGGSQINNAFGGFVTDGGPGANTLSLRGLGATRTLVLLNGRRLSPAGTRGAVGSADLNVLPTAVVDRIEVLKDGASSIYGSDAVAGVINVITRKNFKGFEVEAQANLREAGGGEQTRVAATYGWVGDKSFLTGSLEMYERNDLKWGDVDWMKCQTDYRRSVAGGVAGPWGSGDFIDPRTGQPKCYTITGTGSDGVTINTLGTANLAGVGAPGSVGGVFNRWRPNPAVTTGLAGFEGVGGGANNLNIRDTFDPRNYNNSLISPARSTTVFLQGGLDTGILGNAEAYFEVLATRRDSSQTSFRQLTLDYRRGSPLIPAGLAGVAGNLLPGPTLISPGPIQYRAFIGSGNYESSQVVDYYKALGGLKGDLPLTDWRYDAVVSFSKSKARYGFESFLTDRVANSLDVVLDSNGSITCRNPAGGCVAAPALSPQLLGGTIPQGWLNYVYSNTIGQTSYKETTTTINTNGRLFALPYGEARGALGVEYRSASIDDTPSEDMQRANLYNFTSGAITRGSDKVWELYGELELPLLRKLPLAQELTVNVSGRYTDYQSYGSDTTYKFGALWTPIRAVTLRGSIGTSYRAPALFEQFIGATTGFLSSTGDPCNSPAPGTNRAANCSSQGLPPTFSQTQSITSVTLGGRESGLKAETSENKTFGIIFQPELPKAVGDLAIAVDYYDIRVDNGVDRIGTGNILSLCYDSPGLSSVYCRLVNREAGGPRALRVNNSYVNVSTDVVTGYDVTLRYVRNIGPGTFRGNAVITKYEKQESKLFQNDPFVSVNGIVGSPDLTGVFDFSYTWRDWRFRYGLEWIDKTSSYEFFQENPDTSIFKMNTPSYTLHSLSAEYRRPKWTVVVGVRNLTDQEPPQISSGFASRRGNAPLYSGYDYAGRTWFAMGRFSF